VRALFDTNVLLRAGNADAQVSELDRFLDRLLDGGAVPCICSQTIVEFWAAGSRPVHANGFGWSTADTGAEVERVMRSFEVLPDPPDLIPRWLDLCTQHGVKGRQAYDARLVAVMRGNDASRLVMLNPVDFKRYPGIVLLSPDS
jgi:predicted nucleic acid-binding protein